MGLALEMYLVQKRLQKCEECSAEQSYIYDSVHAHYSCTSCGLVKHCIDEMSYQSCYNDNKYEPRQKYKNFSESIASCFGNANESEKVTKRIMKQQERLFPVEFKKNKLLKYIETNAALLECDERVIDTCVSYIEKNISKNYDTPNNSILYMRGLETTAIALLVIVTQKLKRPMSVRMTQELTNKKNISKHMKKVCRKLNVKVATMGMSKIRYVCFMLDIKPCHVKRIEKTFKLLKNKHQNIGEDTLVGISVYKTLSHMKPNKKEFVSEISKAVKINKNTLNNYIGYSNDKKK